MRIIKLCMVAVAATLLMYAPLVHADVNDFVIHDFHGRYELFNDVNGGRMVVTETIQLTFSDQNHGILRAIPVDYRDNSLSLEVLSVMRDGQDEPFTTYRDANNKVLKIGRPDATITGKHTYKITYGMSNIVGFFEQYDEWYWDTNGDQWQQPFTRVHGEVILPNGWDNQGLPSASCYTGRLGTTQSVCSITPTTTGYMFAAEKQLGGYETLTVAVPVQKGLFAPRTTIDELRDNAWQFVGLALGVGLGLGALRQWYKWGRDHKGRGTIVPQYEPPEGLSPAEVGLLNDYYVHNSDLTATIIDLAVRGYVKIYDEEKKTLGLFKSRSFKLELANDNTGSLKVHEKLLLTAIFKQMVAGTAQIVKDISPTEMQSAVSRIRSELKQSLTKQYGMLEVSPTRAYVIVSLIMAGAGVVFFLAIGSAAWGWALGMAFAGAGSILSLIFMRRRSHAGVEAYEHIKGLRLYMDTAEKDRIKMMQSVDRPYAEPAHNVELFEKLLPYAVALGVEKSWAKQFENIYREQPRWYNGNAANFNAVYFASSLASGIATMNTSFSTSTSSSSSGSGGGGFSGGGGGGGGGGGW